MTRPPLPTFPASAPAALADGQLRANLRGATTTIRSKRAAVASEVPDWEALREAARAIKAEALSDLPRHLLALEDAVTRAGGVVHWAADAAEATDIVGDLVEATGAREVVKVKSITTDEVGMNVALEDRGIMPVETDLAELIIQMAGETSSHFLVPAIHKNRTQIPDLSDDPREFAEAARLHLRRKFLAARVAVSGANFAVAETGTVGVVESEGNGRMCLTLPRVLITLMGIEKVLPRFQDLEVFLQLLPRSATGERMNPYTSLWTGVTPGDGPQEFHLVLLDNGRTRALGDPLGRQALHCIRCSACLNICPVYARVGGHAYHATYPGPIGSILMPQLKGPGVHDSLPFASTLCGACADVCPVKIEIPRVLLHLRARVVEGVAGGTGRDEIEGRPRASAGRETGRIPDSWQERALMRLLGVAFRSPRFYRLLLGAGRFLQRSRARAGWVARLPGFGGGWTLGRDLPALPGQSFQEWWERRRRASPGAGQGVTGARGTGRDLRRKARP
jgi:L-lactate dehydrogenase complex protein LldF